MRTFAALFTALFLAIPTLASASSFGFPRQPLWVSATEAKAGESITVYAAVYNATGDPMKGTVSFLADGTAFDTKDVNLAAGGSTLATAAWSAKEGTHTLSARFESGTEKDTTDAVAVKVAAVPPPTPPVPSVVDQTIQQTTAIVQGLSTSSSPVAKIANAVLNQTENLRMAGADFLEPYAHGTTGTAASTSEANSSHATTSVAKGFTSPASANSSSGKSLLNTGIQTAAAAALFAFDTKWLFYLLAVVLLLLILRGLKRWVNRPRF
ncbi:hypothetical protein K8R03_00560 [Candidatus Kaiserbacteria bacterium]|nr:hypothetical protein [Candidatus Kaiserbacteria bacterium]